MKRTDPKYKKHISQKQEKSVSKVMDGSIVVASGALWHSKGDVRTDDFLIECKTTDSDTYKFRFDTFDKIECEAIQDGLRRPLLILDISGGRYVFFNLYDFDYDILRRECSYVIVKGIKQFTFKPVPALEYHFVCTRNLNGNEIWCTSYDNFSKRLLGR